MSFLPHRLRRLLLLSTASFVGIWAGIDSLEAALIATESFSYNALTDGATLGAASADWTDDGTFGGHELQVSNSGAGASLGAALTAGYVSGNSTFSLGGRRSSWNMQGNTLSLAGGPHYISFLARTNGADSFRLEFGNDTVKRWMPFKVNSDGSVETGTNNISSSNSVSLPGLWQADTTYLVVAKFDSTDGAKSSMSFYDLSEANSAYLTEPATDHDWLLNAGFTSGITLNLLEFTASQGGVSIDEIRIGSSYTDVIPIPAARTLGYIVEQPMTVQPRSWTHTIQEGGNYQIGAAWVEVDSGDNVVIEVFKNGFERFKALYAPAGEVTRFESRIEGLSAGDTLTIKITPNGGRYRVGYQIASGTPTFNGLPIFDVHDPAYGAAGDGTTDDFSAIQAAVNAAKAQGGGIVQFDGTKTYRAIGMNDETPENLIDLVDVDNIKIAGNGASIMLHPPDRLLFVKRGENIQVDGLTVNYDPLPYYQGTIDAIDQANLTVDITVPERYEEPVVGVNLLPYRAPFFAFTFIPESPGARVGDGQHFYVKSTETIGGDPRKIRIHGDPGTPNTPPAITLQHAVDRGATEMVVPHLDYGHRGGFSIEVTESSRVTVSNVLFQVMPHVGILPRDNVGPVTFSNVDLLMKNPETELYWSWRGAYSFTGNNRWGFMLEDGEWHGNAMYDDVLAFFTRRQDIVGMSHQTLNLKLGDNAWLFREGDWLSIWTEGQSELRGMSRVVSVGKKKGDGSFDVTVESIPAGTRLNDVAINEELYNRDTVVRNCKNFAEGASAATTRIRTGGHFIDCDFKGLDFLTEMQEVFQPVRARNLIIENSIFRPSLFSRMSLDGAINPQIIGCTFDETAVFGLLGTEDIYFEGNSWINMTGNIIDLKDGSSAALFGISSRNGISTGLSSYVNVDSSSSITYAAPADYPPATPPLSTSFAPATAPLLSATAGEGRVMLDWADTSGATSYTVYRSQSIDGSFQQRVQLQLSNYVDSRVVPGQMYFYVVTASDASGNESVFGNRVSAQPSGTYLGAQADTYVTGGVSANGNYGSAVELLCKTDTNDSFTRESYFSFDLSTLSGPVNSAVLRLKVASATGSGDVHTAYSIEDDSWTESGIKWNNKPIAGGALASATVPEIGEWIELDVTAQVAAKRAGDLTFSMVLLADGSDLVRYHSKEALESDDRPELLVTMATAPAPNKPTGLSVAVNSNDILLNWADQSSEGVKFYGVYRSTTAGGPFTHVLDTTDNSYLQAPVAEDVTYFYKVTALDGDGNESTYSSEVSAALASPIVIEGLNPVDGLTNLPPDLDLLLTFNKAIAKGSGFIRLVNLTDGESRLIPIGDSEQVSISGATLTINPSENLAENCEYAVRIDAEAIEDLFGNAHIGIVDDITWNFSTATIDVTRVRNGDFSANAGGFTSSPGYVGGENPLTVEGWILSKSGSGNLGINGLGLSTVFGPSDQSAATYYGFLQHGGVQIAQELTGRLRPQRNYQISYLAANRSGNPDAVGRVTVCDENSTYYDSGPTVWGDNAFVAVNADFMTGEDFNGSVYITLSNESPPGDQSVSYSDVSIVQIPDYVVWKGIYPSADLSDPDADWDSDGLSNEEERIWGLDPARASSRQVLVAQLNPGTNSFIYVRRNPALHELNYTIWTSTDLQTWTQDMAASQSVAESVNGAQNVTVTVSHTPVGGRLFVQVRAK